MRGRLFGVAGRDASGVEVSFSETGARALADGLDLFLPFAEARLTPGGTDSHMLVLEVGALTLYVTLAEAVAALPAGAPATVREALDRLAAQQRRLGHRAVLVFIAALAVCVAGGLALWRLTDRALARAVDAIPASWEVRLGDASLLALSAGSTPVTDARVTAPVQRIVRRLTDHLPGTPYAFSAEVWKKDEVNAFALPGGRIVVYTGLLERADDPEEVAGVLAHEVQHVLLRHGLHSIMASLKWKLALSLLMGDAEGVREQVLEKAGRLALLSYSREAERAADRAGAELLYRAGLAPDGMARFFSKLSSEKIAGTDLLAFLSSHPGHEERVASVRGLVRERGPVARVPLDVDWTSLRQALGKL